MTLAEVGEIFAYWAENPPAHLILQAIARILGWAPAVSLPSDPESLDAVAAAAPPGLAVLRRAEPGMPPPVLDPEPLRERNRALVLAAARLDAQ